PEVVEDMEAARKGLGYERVNLISESYGTRVAQIYAWMHPDSVFRSALISVNPPGHMVWEPSVLDEQIMYDAELCAQDAECSARTGDLAETM
ncbi:MAG: alpha/beta fold hydrolase, partial [Anaerolineae bacterium]|nr:alpha/beta fold hydrolase [Anaerolineae bacterium]